jgi:hypothetical protein
MLIRYFPKVRDASQHEFLQGVIKGYPPNPYNEWRDLQEKEMANFRAAQGGEAWLVPFTYHEFTDYCRDTRSTNDFDSFLNFILWKGSRQKK